MSSYIVLSNGLVVPINGGVKEASKVLSEERQNDDSLKSFD